MKRLLESTLVFLGEYFVEPEVSEWARRRMAKRWLGMGVVTSACIVVLVLQALGVL